MLLCGGGGLGRLRSLGKWVGERVPWVLDEAHQFLALLTAAFVALLWGCYSSILFLTFSVTNGSLLLPLGEPYQPLGVSLGVLGLWWF